MDLAGRYVSGEARARSDAAVCRWVAIGDLAGLDMPTSLRDMLKWKGIL